MLGKPINRLDVGDHPDHILNYDKTGLPFDPRGCLVVSEKGQKTVKVVSGSGWERITVNFCVNTAGKAMPPLIVFNGEKVQNTCVHTFPLDHPAHGLTFGSLPGWMLIFYPSSS